MKAESWHLANEIKTVLAAREIEGNNSYVTMRDVECVEMAAKEDKEELLKLFLAHAHSSTPLTTIRAAYHEVTAYSSIPPASLITEHGLKMRDLLRAELEGEFFSNLNAGVIILAMGLPEKEAQMVISLTRRGIFDVEKIQEMLKEMRVAPSLSDGTL